MNHVKELESLPRFELSSSTSKNNSPATTSKNSSPATSLTSEEAEEGRVPSSSLPTTPEQQTTEHPQQLEQPKTTNLTSPNNIYSTTSTSTSTNSNHPSTTKTVIRSTSSQQQRHQLQHHQNNLGPVGLLVSPEVMFGRLRCVSEGEDEGRYSQSSANETDYSNMGDDDTDQESDTDSYNMGSSNFSSFSPRQCFVVNHHPQDEQHEWWLQKETTTRYIHKSTRTSFPGHHSTFFFSIGSFLQVVCIVLSFDYQQYNDHNQRPSYQQHDFCVND